MKIKIWQSLSIIVLLFVLITWIIDLYQHALVPTKEEWQQSISEIKKELQPTDGITWFPEWASEGKIELRALKNQAFYLPYQSKVDLGKYQRIWLMSTFNHDFDDFLNHFEFNQKPKKIKEQKIGDITLYLLEVTEPKIVAQLYDQLPQTQVFALPINQNLDQNLDQKRACDYWDGQAWHCDLRRNKEQTTQCLNRPLAQKLKYRSRDRSAYYLDGRRNLPYLDCGLNPLEHIGQDIRVIDGDPRYCIWLPPHQKRDILIEWQPHIDQALLSKSNPPSQALSLEMQYGWEELVVDHPFRENIPLTDIDVEIKVEGQNTIKKRFTPNIAWKNEKLSLITYQSNQGFVPKIQFLVHAQPKNQDAKFCINLNLRF